MSFIGRKHLSEDASVSSNAYARLAGRIAYSFAEGWAAFGQANWYPGDRTSEVALSFGNATGGSSADFFTSPQPRVAVLVGVSRRFNTGPR